MRKSSLAGRFGRCTAAAMMTLVGVISTGPPAKTDAGRPPEISFAVDQKALLELVRAATPYSVTIGNQLIGADLVFTDPSELLLVDGQATLRIRVKGHRIPIDQVLRPAIRIEYDPALRQYFAIVSSLVIEIPGLGKVDLRDALPRVAIPAVVDRLWALQDRPIGMRLRIRSITIGDERLEIGADVEFPRVTG